MDRDIGSAVGSLAPFIPWPLWYILPQLSAEPRLSPRRDREAPAAAEGAAAHLQGWRRLAALELSAS